MKQKDLTTYIKISLLSAIAVILMYIDFPVIPLFPWLKIDLSEVPVLMGAFAFGPMTGIVIELIKNLLIIVFKGTYTGFVGEVANFIVGISLVVPASTIYKRNKTKKSSIIGMIVGILILEVVGIIANVYFLLPAYGMKMDFAFGPMTGIVIELIKNLLIIVFKGTYTGFVGEVANFIVGISLVVPASTIYKRNKTKKSSIIGMIVGILILEVVGIIANVYFLLPAYGMKMDSSQLMQYVTLGLLPFNGIKGIIVSISTYLLYKRLSLSIFRSEYMRDSTTLGNKLN